MVDMSPRRGKVAAMTKAEIRRRLREALASRSTVEIAEACRVDQRTVRNWRDGKLPRSPAIRSNLETYLDRVTAS